MVAPSHLDRRYRPLPRSQDNHLPISCRPRLRPLGSVTRLVLLPSFLLPLPNLELVHPRLSHFRILNFRRVGLWWLWIRCFGRPVGLQPQTQLAYPLSPSNHLSPPVPLKLDCRGSWHFRSLLPKPSPLSLSYPSLLSQSLITKPLLDLISNRLPEKMTRLPKTGSLSLTMIMRRSSEKRWAWSRVSQSSQPVNFSESITHLRMNGPVPLRVSALPPLIAHSQIPYRDVLDR